jgi:hypothetical protein
MIIYGCCGLTANCVLCEGGGGWFVLRHSVFCSTILFFVLNFKLFVERLAVYNILLILFPYIAKANY